MNDIIAQVIAIIGYGNDYLQVGNLLYDFDSNCIFQYCKSVDFIYQKKKGLFSKKVEMLIADSPTGWFKYLNEKGCLKLRLHFKSQRPDDYMTAGFVGGGGIWLIETVFEDHSDFWNAEWSSINQNAPDNKIWQVKYKCISKDRPTIDKQYDLLEIKTRLKNSLTRIESFALEENLEYWGKLFESARRLLDEKNPYKDSYLQDILPKNNYSIDALQLLFAAFFSFVFGGMRSWNDGVAKNHKKHKELSKILYEDIVDAIVSAVNSF